MFSLLYELYGAIMFMFYLHLFDIGKESFKNISTDIKNKSNKYKMIILVLILSLFLILFYNYLFKK